MAEAAVEMPISDRFYCHSCTTEVTPNLPEYTCSRCQGGFIEPLSEGAHNPAPSPSVPPDNDPAAQFEMLTRVILNSIHLTPDSPDRLQSSETPGQSDGPDGGLENSVSYNFSPMPAFRRTGTRSNRNPYLETMMNYLVTRDSSLQSFAFPMFQLHGNPGDYAWGATGLDTIISQLLNQLDASGAPPAEKDMIDALPTVVISELHVEKNLQCSICMDDFNLREECRRLPCDHHYHSECIIKWLQMHGTCPVCRKDLNGQDSTSRSGGHGAVPSTSRRDSSSSPC